MLGKVAGQVETSNRVMPCDWEKDVPCGCMICCADSILL